MLHCKLWSVVVVLTPILQVAATCCTKFNWCLLWATCCRPQLATREVIRATTHYKLQSNNVARHLERKCCPYWALNSFELRLFSRPSETNILKQGVLSICTKNPVAVTVIIRIYLPTGWDLTYHYSSRRYFLLTRSSAKFSVVTNFSNFSDDEEDRQMLFSAVSCSTRRDLTPSFLGNCFHLRTWWISQSFWATIGAFEILCREIMDSWTIPTWNARGRHHNYSSC